MWWVATALLAVMSIVFLASTRFQESYTWLAPVRAFAEAAMVGALADWFAVTALFRHPLGIPIPHTAIIPNNKTRIGRNLGHFIQSNFLSEKVLEGEAVNISGFLARWLENPSNRRSVVRRVRRLVPRLLETVEEDEIRRFIDLQFEDFVRNVEVSKSAARILRILSSNGMHEVLLDEVVRQSQSFFRSNEDWFRTQIRESSPWFVPEFVDRKILEAIIAKTERTLAEALADRNHELRLRVHAAVEQFISKLENQPEFHARGEEVKQMLLTNEVFRRYIGTIREALVSTIRSDIERDDSHLAAAVERALENFVQTISTSHEIQERINLLIRRVMGSAFGDQSGHVAEIISRTMESWDTSTLVTKMEEQVGSDLQYIRINGTLVGGLVGLCLYVLTQLLNVL